jgi:hypothetical protein
VFAFVARRRHAEQVSALAGLQLTSIVGVQPAQLAGQSGYFIVDPINPGRLRLFIAGVATMLRISRAKRDLISRAAEGDGQENRRLLPVPLRA